MKNPITIEICAASYEDCLAAWESGAQRVELNSALYLGGLTPSLSSLLRTKQNTKLTVICMCRPRAGGFCYSESEVHGMFLDAEIMLKNGADGIAFGFLNEDRSINLHNTQKMVQLIHSYHKTAVFHRAFDVTPDPDEAMKALLACGVDRLLTSGQRFTALQGLNLIRALQIQYGDRIEILPASRINAENAIEILKESKVKALHSSCKAYEIDPTTSTEDVSFSYLSAPHADCYEKADKNRIAQLVNVSRQFIQ